ncbi:MAG TPA: heat-inducible transcription repressor HrcA [Anaerolineaceae bacterium]|jgi:heat-inducible transcriptional repressor|nr:heat-inducible transcription repressor HrcA [Anaerolineaceae bacterium]HQN69014.1 heat-inducible transcriptional repressor HrcA [Anaerolineaceae bacterium]
MTTLSERQKIILSLVVHEHIKGSQAVASGALIRDYNLKISSATVRAELNTLTELGYLRQPHTSAGRVPTEEGYRYFVNNLLNQSDLPATTRNTINHQFYQSDKGLHEWLPLAASVLATQNRAVSIVTSPHTKRVAFKHLELISVRGSQVLMVLVLVGGEIRQQIISLDNIYTQNQLSDLAQKINNGCENSTLDEIEQFRLIDEPLSDTILNAVADQMRFSEDYANGKLFMDGLTNVLGADEPVDPDQARVALKLIEERQNLDDLMLRANHNQEIGGVQVLIGCENTWQELRDWSIILTRYGVPEQMSGTLGILGPMRMPYGHAINTVRFVGELLSDLISENMVE